MIVGIVQARMSSTRLPGKVLMPILGEPMLARQVERLKRARSLDRLVIATSVDPSDDAIAELASRTTVESYRGSLKDVLDRYYQAALPLHPSHVVRLTADCPLADWEVIDQAVELALTGGFDYASNTLRPTWPDGLDVEVMTFEALAAAWSDARGPVEREHVTPFIVARPERFRHGSLEGETDLSGLRWTVDEPSDFAFIRRVYEELYPEDPAFTTADILSLLREKPELAEINQGIGRNEGLERSMRESSVSEPRSYRRSEQLLEEALEFIPLGAQTFSKSITQYPRGAAPLFIDRAEGSRAWDADGNEYRDFNNALCAVTLGHCDPDVTAAVERELRRGTIFSLSSEIEVEVARLIVETVPCAEKVRFGKNGSDATSGAIRAARAFTGRNRVAMCGYHGWQDWSIGSTLRNKGIPRATQELTHTFAYNDLDSLDRLLGKHRGEFAAVILEPMNVAWPAPGFLDGVVRLAAEHGAISVFDETITGFRYSVGGAQALFGVTPDLACFGKGLANGYPLSAVAGRADVMREFEEVFFSFTMGGERLSLAAAVAAINKTRDEKVPAALARQGQKILDGLAGLVEKHGCGEFLSVAGHPSWSFLLIRDAEGADQWEVRTLYIQEMVQRGILTLGSHNMSFAHSDEDVQQLLDAYDEVLPLLSSAVRDGNVRDQLRCEPLKPLFRVR